MARKPTAAGTLLQAAKILERIAEKVGETPPWVSGLGGGSPEEYAEQCSQAARYMGRDVRAIFNNREAIVHPGMTAADVRIALGFPAEA